MRFLKMCESNMMEMEEEALKIIALLLYYLYTANTLLTHCTLCKFILLSNLILMDNMLTFLFTHC